MVATPQSPIRGGRAIRAHAILFFALLSLLAGVGAERKKISLDNGAGRNFAWECKTAGHKGNCAQLERPMASYDIVSMLDIGVITDFLPIEKAKELLEILKGMDDEDWTQIDNRRERAYGNSQVKRKATVDMDYKMVDLQLEAFKDVRDKVMPLFSEVFQGPNQKMSLYFGKYSHGSYVTSHTDGAVVTLNGHDKYDRKRAFLLYLNEEWEEEEGGLFTDEENEEQSFVPGWNTLLHFRVPRWHLVTPVRANKVRWSVYGWSLENHPTDFERFISFMKKDGTQPYVLGPILFILIVSLRLYLFPVDLGFGKKKADAKAAAAQKAK
mmetsp:Transcript_11070/g.27133  ORF Transcript_11070/g.27133 Transcript_11070/m.27133 type:complete len:325 (+) Transcript_11070:80-1054(+)